MLAALRRYAPIAKLIRHQAQVLELGGQLAGDEFACERGWITEAEFEERKSDWPWLVGALHAHEQRVRLDYEVEWAAWIAAEIGDCRLRKAPIRSWQMLRDRRCAWRIDRVDLPPRGDLFELEERTRWFVIHVRSNRTVVERTFERHAEFHGQWRPTGESGPSDMRIEGDTLFIRERGVTENVDLKVLLAR